MSENIIATKHKEILMQSMNPNMELLDWQMIRDYLNNRLNGMKLTKIQQDKLARYQFIYAQLYSGRHSENDVIEQVQRFFKDVSPTQAVQDLRCSKEIFSTTLKIHKRFEIKLQIDRLKVEQQKCLEFGKPVDFAAISKVILEYLKMLPDEEPDDAELFKGHTNIIDFNPAILGAEKIPMKDINELLAEIQTKFSFRDNVIAFDIEEAEVINDEKNHE